MSTGRSVRVERDRRRRPARAYDDRSGDNDVLTLALGAVVGAVIIFLLMRHLERQGDGPTVSQTEFIRDDRDRIVQIETIRHPP